MFYGVKVQLSFHFKQHPICKTPILKPNFMPMKKQTLKSNDPKARREKRFKASKKQSDTKPTEDTRKLLRASNKRLRYYFLNNKERQDLKGSREGWETALKSFNSYEAIIGVMFTSYVMSRLDISFARCRILFVLLSYDGDCCYRDYIRIALLPNHKAHVVAWNRAMDFFVGLGLAVRTSGHFYKCSDYCYYVMERLLKDYKDISTPSAVDSRHA